MTTENSDTIASDVLRGAKQIGEFIGLKEKDAFHHLERGHVPAFKMGGIWTSTKTRLRAHYNTAQYVPPDEDQRDTEHDQPIVPRRRIRRSQSARRGR